jgi:hypothetical protein
MTMMVMVMVAVFPIQRVMADERRSRTPKNLLDKLKVASSRDPSGVVAINRECYGSKCSTFYINTIEYLPWLVPLCPPSHPWLVFQHGNSLGILCSTSASYYEGPFWL